MNILIIAFTFILIPLKSYSINTYSTNDTLFVWANNGLSLRDINSQKGNRINLIPYGEKIIVLQSNIWGYHDTSINIFPLEENNSFLALNLDGSWVKVRYGNNVGYVYDGYLSKFPAPLIIGDHNHEDLDNYLERVFGILKESSKEVLSDEVLMKTTYYNRGISKQNIFSKSAGVKYVLPDFSIEELILFIKNSELTTWHSNNPRLISREQLSPSIQVLKFKLSVYGDGILVLTQISNVIILEHSSSC